MLEDGPSHTLAGSLYLQFLLLDTHISRQCAFRSCVLLKNRLRAKGSRLKRSQAEGDTHLGRAIRSHSSSDSPTSHTQDLASSAGPKT